MVGVVQKRWVLQQVFDKGDVGRHATNTEFAQRAVHASDGHLGRRGLGRDLGQEAVVVTGDHPARIGCATIQTNAHASGFAVGSDTAIIGNEVVLRVFGCDACLQGMTGQHHVFLGGLAGRVGNGLAFGNQDLRLDDVDAGDFFGHGMFDLHAWVHFDEIEFAIRHIHQEFDSARTFVIHVFANLVAKLANLGPLFFSQVRRRGTFDHFLVAPLDRAIALKQVIHPAMLVAQDLNLDVAGLEDHLFQIPLTIAKGRLCLAPPLQHFFLDLVLGHDRAHAAPTPAP